MNEFLDCKCHQLPVSLTCCMADLWTQTFLLHSRLCELCFPEPDANQMVFCSDCLAHDRWWDAVFLCLPCPRWRGVVVAERLFDLYLFNLSTPRALPISAWEEGRTEVGLAELASWSNNTCCRCSITVLNIKSLPTITTCFFFPYSILSFANTPQNTNSQWHI